MVSFLEFTLNTLGDPQSTANQKETIIQESYLKAFRDPEVQIEDDLVENRATVTNKDVQAYLKDVDFFFREARFEFQIEEVTHEINERGELYFRIAGSRNLFALTIQGDTLNNSQERFIEINLDPETRNLKIASIYTSKLSEQEDLRNWWNDMPTAWQKVFESKVFINDSLSLERVYELSTLFRPATA
ncbi:MAG: leucine-rich repeat domain-containing protein, partial [Bacteroidota bacterium]